MEEEWVKDPKISYDDFVGVYKNVYPPGYCTHVISEFERLSNMGAGSTRQKNKDGLKHEKDDISQYWTFNHLSIADFKDNMSKNLLDKQHMQKLSIDETKKYSYKIKFYEEK